MGSGVVILGLTWGRHGEWGGGGGGGERGREGC